MGVEVEEHYGGSGMSFMSAIITIEELARVDPSVSVMVDVQVRGPSLCAKGSPPTEPRPARTRSLTRSSASMARRSSSASTFLSCRRKRSAASACPRRPLAATRSPSRCAYYTIPCDPFLAGGRSSAARLQTKATLDGDHYVLNGSKMWITNSGEAEIFLVFANVDFSKGYKGITCFVVEKDWGVQIGKKENKVRRAPLSISGARCPH